MIGGRDSNAAPRVGRPALLLTAVAAQILAGPPPRGESWLSALAARVPDEGVPLGRLAVPLGLSRAPTLIDWLPASARSLAEVGLLAASFDVVGCDRTAARIERLLEAGRAAEAAALLPELRGEPAEPAADIPDDASPPGDAPDSHAVASETIAALARRPQRYVAPWLSYGLLGLRGTMPLSLRPVWQAALSWRSPLARRWTSARAAPTVRTLSDGAAAAASVALAPLLGSSAAETWRAVASAHSEPEIAAMAALLDRSLVVDGEPVNDQAAPAGPEDVRRARRIAWAIAAAAACASVGLIFATRLLRRIGLHL